MASIEVRILEKIPKSSLICGKSLGQGGFGSVVNGTLNGKDVAVKILHSPVRAESYVEFNFMFQMKHRNLTRMLGLVDLGYTECPQLIFLKASQGNLLQYVENIEDNVLEPLKKGMLNKFAIDVINGMEYLHKMHYLHKTLSARNVLIHKFGDYLNAQVCDYGISRVIDGQGCNYYKTAEGVTLPIRWIPKECIPSSNSTGTFTFASDVWSFGVVLWECWTKGDTPYGAARSNTEVRQLVLTGSSPLTFFRPQCPADVMGVMESIFRDKPEDRPTFTDLGKSFNSMKPKNNRQKKESHSGQQEQQNADKTQQEKKNKKPKPPRQEGNHQEEQKPEKFHHDHKKKQPKPSGQQENDQGCRPDGGFNKGPKNSNRPPGQNFPQSHHHQPGPNIPDRPQEQRNPRSGRNRRPPQEGPHIPSGAPPPYSPPMHGPPPQGPPPFNAPPSFVAPPPPFAAQPPPFPAAGNAEAEMQKKMLDLQQKISSLEMKQLEQKLQNLQKEVDGSKTQSQPRNPNQQHHHKKSSNQQNPNKQKHHNAEQKNQQQNPPHAKHKGGQGDGNQNRPQGSSTGLPDWVPAAGAILGMAAGAAIAAAAMKQNNEKSVGKKKK